MEQERRDTECFEALSRICLNNWHYIGRKILSFNQEINFFTGHSGSGKSTVIDAMQLVLYANTDGRGFFNKAAADDSDRNLIEYLRGMVNIGENNEFSYLRNRNFSTTIVLELKRTDNGQCQCVGVVFDVETASNDISRRFFWHKGPLWENEYRSPGAGRAMTIAETEQYLAEHYTKEEYFCTSHNERFRRQLYEVYLGGLDPEKFPLLFKRAIPFRMNIRLEDFVREYICMEQDIHIEDMQDSVMQYGRMQKKIEDTSREIEALTQLSARYEAVREKEQTARKYAYFTERLETFHLRLQEKEAAVRIGRAREELALQMQMEEAAGRQAEELKSRGDELLRRIASTGYEELRIRLQNLNELLERLEKSGARWQQASEGLRLWLDEDVTSNRTIWDIEEFRQKTISPETLTRLKESLAELNRDAARERQEAAQAVREYRRKEKQAQEELAQLKAGSKAYPKYLEYVRSYLTRRLLEETRRPVEVHVLADLLEIRNEPWRNAVEGYLAGSKLALVVPPAYAKKAMEIYGELDKKEYWGAAVLDTETVSALDAAAGENTLAEEVTVREDYLRPYLNYLLGRVQKCSGTAQLKKCRIGITQDCMVYKGYRLQYLNPDNYTRLACIGKASVKRRIRLLEEELAAFAGKRKPEEERVRECDRLLGLEKLDGEVKNYLEWLEDIRTLKERSKEKEKLEAELERLKAADVAEWEKEREAVEALRLGKEEERRELNRRLSRKQDEIRRLEEEALRLAQELLGREREAAGQDAEDAGSQPENRERSLERQAFEEELASFLKGKENPRFDKLRDYFKGQAGSAREAAEQAFSRLVNERLAYLKAYPNRSLPAGAKDNRAYEALLTSLSCRDLEHYRQAAAEQAKTAVEHFKDDFMFKIRSAIREAIQRKDELNRVISSLNFGKDQYQFVIGKNKGPDGRFYDMFMDDALEVNPSQLSESLDNQMNFFTMEHESQYGERIRELIQIFIPPDHAAPEEMEEARRNMDRYADYRTYLSFDMQQLIRNEDGIMKIRLSKMIKKNSGGEGQNPLYVALLASFAQAYRIGLKPGFRKNPSIRLVVLDEAFSKMDAEKVASCIQLIRDLGFQAIISATNDKIQNYVENVNKTFVFANPNKKSISIQEFEREEFGRLVE